MKKVIPKREGQKLQGIFPSVFALAFLLVAVPFASTYLVTGALSFGGESVVEGYDRTDVILGNYPYYKSTGDGTESKCIDMNEASAIAANCAASLQQFAPASLGGTSLIGSYTNSGGKWYQALPGCANGTSSNPGTFMNPYCGDSNFIIAQNITDKMKPNKIAPIIESRVKSDWTSQCNGFRGGDSFVDYTIRINTQKRIPALQGTNLWTAGYIQDEVKFTGTHEFDSVIKEGINISLAGGSSAGIPLPTVSTLCKAQIEVIHELDFAEIQELTDLLEKYHENNTDFFGIFLEIEFDNIRSDDGYKYSQIGYYNPFWGNNDSRVEFTLDFVTFKGLKKLNS